MTDGINIPIKVSGAEEAKAELQGVAQAVGQARDARGRFTPRGAAPAQAAAQVEQATGAETAAQIANSAATEKAAAATEQLAERKRALAAASQAAAQAEAQGGAAAAETAKQTAGEAQATKDATEKKQVFSREGRVLAATLLTEINPAMGSMVLLLSHLVRGLAEVSMGLIALVGAAALLGGVVSFFQQLKAEAEALRDAVLRVNEAMRAARETGAGQRATLAQNAWNLGLYGRAGEMQRESTRLQNEGIIASVADNTALARQVASREGIAFDPDVYMRGLTTRGMKPIDFGAHRDKGLAELQRVMEAGKSEEAARAFASAKAETETAAKLNAPNPAGNIEDSLDVAMAHMRVARPDLKSEEATAIERLVREGVLKLPDPWHGAMHAGIVKTGIGSLFRTGGNIESASAALGGTQTVGQLVELAQRVASEARFREGRNDGAQIPTTQPVNVTIHNTTNVDTMYSGPSLGEAYRQYDAFDGPRMYN